MSCNEWKTVKLGDVADVLSGYAFKTKDFIEEGVPVVKIKNIIPPNIDINDTQYVSNEMYEEKIKYALNYNDILISMTGSNVNQIASAVGKIGRVKLKYTKLLLNQRVGKLFVKDNSKCNYDYLYYYLIQPEIRYNLAANAGGSANQANISPADIKNIDIKLPSLEEQEKIVNILSCLDDKIELNNEMNKTLEEMAQSIFKRWFVDFEFPNEDGQPYKSSGGEMVESEFGMIPKDWEVKALDEILDSISIKHKFPNEKIIFLNTSDILDGEVLHNNYSDVNSLPGQAKKSIQKGDILYSEIRPKNKRYTFIDFDADDYVVSTKLMVLRTKNRFNPAMIYFYLTNEDTINYLQTIAEGRSGTFPQITFNELKKLKICVPNNNTIAKQGDFFENILKTINNNKKEVKQLKEMRDTLLLKLMSGEIRV